MKRLLVLMTFILALCGCARSEISSPEISSSTGYISSSEVESASSTETDFRDDTDLPGHFEGENRSYRVISTAEELLSFAECVLNRESGYLQYEWHLGADIDMTGYDFQPIGEKLDINEIPYGEIHDYEAEQEMIYSRCFAGAFDGCGYTVSGIFCIGNKLYDTGFFSALHKSAIVRNLNVEGTFIGQRQVGGISGGGGGTIEGCSFSGRIYAVGDCAGGIAGCSGEDTHITECFADAEVYGCYDVGCLVGSANNNSVITDCSCRGRVHGITTEALRELLGEDQPPRGSEPDAYFYEGRPNHIGGLAGGSYGSELLRCVADVVVIAESETGLIGNFIGYHSGRDIDCYYVDDYMKWGAGYAYSGSNSIFEAKGITLSELKNEETFYDYRFGKDWEMKEGMPMPVRTRRY